MENLNEQIAIHDLDSLDDNLKKRFEVEIGMYERGEITKDILLKAINKTVQNDDKIKKKLGTNFKRRQMEILVKVLYLHPELLDNIKKIMDYRKLRIEQVLYPNLIEEARQDANSGELKIDLMRQRVISLDRKRREYHNTALGNFYGIVRAVSYSDLPPIYTGKIMDISKQPDHYGDHRVREEMTDGMLGLLYNIEDTSINELNIGKEKYDEGLGTFKEIHDMLNHQNHDYGIRNTLKKDDGDIEFY